jgi:bilin biosynthesis protein
MNHPQTPLGSAEVQPLEPTPQETDALLARVTEQLHFDTLDREDGALLRQLVNSLGDTRGMIRLRCAETLGEIGESATPYLVEALAHHGNVVVRRAAAKTLTLIADASAIPALLNALFQDEDTVVKGSSVGALARIGAESVPALLDILAAATHPESTKGHAAWALAFIGAQAKDVLYREVHSASPAVRAAVVGAIAKVAQEEPQEAQAFQFLIQALDDEAEMVRCEAAAALGNLAYQPAAPALMALLDHSEIESRKAAALALMKLGDPQSLPALRLASSQADNDPIQPIFRLAIAQLTRQSTASAED